MENTEKIVITGMGSVSAYGQGITALFDGIKSSKSIISKVPELEELSMVETKIASTIAEMDYSFIPRRDRRSMSKMAKYAYVAAKEALAQAGYEVAPNNLGFFMGSTLNSIAVWLNISAQCHEKHLELVKTSDFLQIMNHSPLATVAQALKINGPTIGASEACATGALNIGLAYQAIKAGLVTQALCGGTEEYHPMFSACFDIMQATSRNFNDTPDIASRPFDENRTGLVCAEGCGLLFLETLSSAKARNAKVLAEVVGFYSNTDTENMAYPSKDTLVNCMKGALKQCNISAEQVNLVNAHATGTIVGDIAESQAVAEVFGNKMPITSLKGHLGHTMGASGSLETIACVDMLANQEIYPTKNLQKVDERCADLHYVTSAEKHPLDIVLKNSFAIGGNNCSLILRRVL